MPLHKPNFNSSVAFDVINDVLAADNEERENAVKSAKAVFCFTLTNDSGETESWYLDFKDKGVAGQGTAPEGGKADVTLLLSDADFGSLITGSSNAQRLFMGGKLKVRGNVMKAMKMEPILKKAQTKAKL
ncbi:hypothetical protein LOZ53_000984 [Ophidiomyces ophidiicola]|uniref:Uncharacterized protein n=1 Tax=Ophidiomyces ophidiicola TaxID=1387563 RepID=A0ACB8V1K8_9EURO|nr:uncharacterized protein LOZ57_003582 [Ophidiomyces ophidiicola]KAI1912514.1 hypothetical protein LOZ64_004405 [Ophidiomyces ophidiicola]KAI1914654.1 hypothetical protein LOZ61_002055 [Ophidiomyces ophidiicola]KAI1930878.1 hypothetical protein LOZ60_000538 [Ophidiomyces ophidiicola]KAI1935694.1 hypothetical protein LOZ62_005907 [Ophidiomyces ophidiicola]KAI1946812.1 hypothetical protein LOZ57_003582 [Ophidiomyces ophidiicola]